MDFTTRGTQPQVAAPSAHQAGSASGGSKKGKGDSNKLIRIGTFILGGALAVLLIAAIITIATGSVKSEHSYVDKNKLQAVFLNTGQVYFGNIKTLNRDYLVLSNIYYLQTSNGGTASASANSNVTLVKLGCELHEPFDQMVINSKEVTFWENLQDNGQVAKAVQSFEKQNPNGQKCTDQSASSSSTSNSVQSAGNNNAAPAATNNSANNSANTNSTTNTSR